MIKKAHFTFLCTIHHMNLAANDIRLQYISVTGQFILINTYSEGKIMFSEREKELSGEGCSECAKGLKWSLLLGPLTCGYTGCLKFHLKASFYPSVIASKYFLFYSYLFLSDSCLLILSPLKILLLSFYTSVLYLLHWPISR